LKPSAIAPPINENSMIGSVVDACTSATMSTESEIEVISHAAPTPWMRLPKLEPRLASHRARNIGSRRGAIAQAESEDVDVTRPPILLLERSVSLQGITGQVG
jgi:hypothetical protein